MEGLIFQVMISKETSHKKGDEVSKIESRLIEGEEFQLPKVME